MMNFNLNSFAAHQANSSVLREYRFDPILLLRLAVATVLVVLSLLVNMSEILQMVLLILAALIAGYDLVLLALDKVLNRQFLHSDVLIVIAAFISYFIRFAMEGAAIVILYQIGLILIDYTKYRFQLRRIDPSRSNHTSYRDAVVHYYIDLSCESDWIGLRSRTWCPVPFCRSV